MALIVAAPSLTYFLTRPKVTDQDSSTNWDERSAMHDNVRRIAAFLEVNPSLISAIRYAHGSMPDRSGNVLGGLIWSARSRGKDFSREYSSFKERWMKKDPLVGKALSDLEVAEKEPTALEVSISARRAMDDLTEGSRREMSRYIQSLQGPTTALFAIGVLLPVLLATMIPVSGIGGQSVYMLVFLLWIGIPLGILYFGSRIVERRPRFRMGEIRIRERTLSFTPLSVTMFCAGSVLIALWMAASAGIGVPKVPWPGLDSDESWILTMLWGLSLTVSALLIVMTKRDYSEVIELRKLENNIPDLLHRMGSAISEGISFEGALRRSQNEIGSKYAEMLAPPPGLPMDHSRVPSPLANAYKAVKYFSRSGAESGGRAIRALGNHTRNMLSLEDEVSQRVEATIGQMEITSSLFAPLMIGASVGIFQLLDPEAMAEGMVLLGGGGSGMDSPTFILISGVYLLILSTVSSVAITRLKNGSKVGGLERAPLNMIRATLSFTIGALGAIALLVR